MCGATLPLTIVRLDTYIRGDVGLWKYPKGHFDKIAHPGTSLTGWKNLFRSRG